jgi:hypothetical protein
MVSPLWDGVETYKQPIYYQKTSQYEWSLGLRQPEARSTSLLMFGGNICGERIMPTGAVSVCSPTNSYERRCVVALNILDQGRDKPRISFKTCRHDCTPDELAALFRHTTLNLERRPVLQCFYHALAVRAQDWSGLCSWPSLLAVKDRIIAMAMNAAHRWINLSVLQ